tara:strand:+ start:2877 stop:3086 length:210 start_codon:yes stop_codon:yes gene_type:complete
MKDQTEKYYLKKYRNYNCKLIDLYFYELIEILLDLVNWEDKKINLDYLDEDEEKQKQMIVKQIKLSIKN